MKYLIPILLSMFLAFNAYPQTVSALTVGAINQNMNQNILSQQQTQTIKSTVVVAPATVVNQPTTQAQTVTIVYADNQNPQVFRMPNFAYIGTRPLTNQDKIVRSVRYSANGKTLFEKIPNLHEQTYLKWNCDPKRMRMLVVSKNINKSFSLSGNVNASYSDYSNWNQYGALNKGATQTLNNYGSIGPSYSQSWTSQSFDIWFFLTEP